MKEFIKKYYAYMMVVIGFYFLPLLMIKDTGSAISVLLLMLPLIIFNISLIYAKDIGFKCYFPIFVALCWLPTVYLYYNESAFIYSALYGVVSLLGQGIGFLFKRYLR